MSLFFAAKQETEERRAEERRTEISVSAAYGIIGLTVVFVLGFRAVSKKLEDWKLRAQRM